MRGFLSGFLTVLRQPGLAQLAACLLFAIPPLAGGSALGQTSQNNGADSHGGEPSHLGVATCGSSACHGAPQPWRNSSVQQNEFLTWIKQDPHARAYKALLSDDGKRIARNLGLPTAHEASICLNCHADNVPAAQRSRAFQISDGVGCESCHGGAERWLGLHVSGSGTHAQNVAAGMFPLDDPVRRAEKCLGCHMGNADRWLSHRIMGAGHPRLRFELDTFTAAEPAHYRVDNDYRQRKQVSSPAKTWIVGQALASATFLDGLGDPKRNRPGLFPELVFYDCHACHHPMSERQFEAAPETGKSPGLPRLQDISLVLLRIGAEAMDPELAEVLGRDLKRLHDTTAGQSTDQMAAARALRADVGRAIPKLQREPGKEQVRLILDRLFALAATPGYRNYETAEQLTMAFGTMLAHLHQQKFINEEQFKRMSAALDQLYKTVDNDSHYSVEAFVSATQGLKNVLPAF